MSEKQEPYLEEHLEEDHYTSARHDHSSNQTRSETESSKNEPQIEKLSSRLKIYQSSEFEGNNEAESFIGSGSFSTVHKYRHKDLETVAIKQFKITGSAKRVNKAWEMVQREANVLCRFQHPNVLTILGITKWLNAVGIIMEYVDGGDLKDLFEDCESELTWSTRLQIALDLISALTYIHNYKKNKMICHGDLKPENILLTKSREVKLADFGSAALYQATGASATTLDIAPSKQHTLQYVAPELLKDLSRERNPAMDMYSFGSILYEMITGRAPYYNFPLPTALSELITAGRKPNMELINQVENQVNSPEDRSAFDLLKNLMERCWDYDPALRPSSKTVEKEMRIYMQKQQPRGPTHRGSPPVASFEEASWNENENEAADPVLSSEKRRKVDGRGELSGTHRLTSIAPSNNSNGSSSIRFRMRNRVPASFSYGHPSQTWDRFVERPSIPWIHGRRMKEPHVAPEPRVADPWLFGKRVFTPFASSNNSNASYRGLLPTEGEIPVIVDEHRLSSLRTFLVEHSIPWKSLFVVDVKVRYGETEMDHFRLDLSSGKRLSYGNVATMEQLMSIMEPEASGFNFTSVEMPSYNGSNKHVKEVLDKTDLGFTLKIDQNAVLHVTRLCQSRMFYFETGSGTSSSPVKLERYNPVELFSYKKFVDELLKQKRDSITIRPDTEIRLFIGAKQLYLSSRSIVCVTIEPTAIERFYEEFIFF